MKKRLAIILVYDKDGVIDASLVYLLKEIKTVSSKVVVICNGFINNEGLNCLDIYADSIILRDNIGFELLGFKEYFMHNSAEMSEYDELIMCNNSFFGPFVPLKSIFEEMDSKMVDFWGIGLSWNSIINIVTSYFRVFRKKIIDNKSIEDYFNNIIIPDNIKREDAVVIYEYGLYANLIYKGYTFSAYAELTNIDMYTDGLSFLNKTSLLKKKSFSAEFANADILNSCIEKIANDYQYDINSLLKEVDRLYGDEWKNSYVIKKGGENEQRYNILKFLSNNREIYIYGAGFKAKKFFWCYKMYVKDICGFIVSDGHRKEKFVYGVPVFEIGEINDKNISVVVALSRENLLEIQKYLKKDYNVLIV